VRKWLYLLLVWAVLYAFSRINTPRTRKRYPLLKRIDRALNVVVWVLLAAYLVTFGWWLATEVFS